MPRHTGLPKRKRKMTLDERIAFESKRTKQDLRKRVPPPPVSSGSIAASIAGQPVERTSAAVSDTPISVSTVLSGQTALEREKKATGPR